MSKGEQINQVEKELKINISWKIEEYLKQNHLTIGQVAYASHSQLPFYMAKNKVRNLDILTFKKIIKSIHELSSFYGLQPKIEELMEIEYEFVEVERLPKEIKEPPPDYIFE